MLYLIGIGLLIFIAYHYRLQDADAGSSEFVISLLVGLLILCLVKIYRIVN